MVENSGLAHHRMCGQTQSSSCTCVDVKSSWTCLVPLTPDPWFDCGTEQMPLAAASQPESDFFHDCVEYLPCMCIRFSLIIVERVLRFNESVCTLLDFHVFVEKVVFMQLSL